MKGPSPHLRAPSRLLRGRGLLACLALAFLGACDSGSPVEAPADLVLLGGNVITVDPQDRIAQAVAVRDGKIVGVGSNSEMEGFIGSGTARVELNGRAVTPGLLDAHAHFWSSGANRLYVLDLSYPNVTSIGEVAAEVSPTGAKVISGASKFREAGVLVCGS